MTLLGIRGYGSISTTDAVWVAALIDGHDKPHLGLDRDGVTQQIQHVLAIQDKAKALNAARAIAKGLAQMGIRRARTQVSELGASNHPSMAGAPCARLERS